MNRTSGGEQSQPRSGRPVAEARWPSVGAVVAAMVLTVLVPAELRLAPAGLLPLLEATLLLALVFADPGHRLLTALLGA
jgi:hypothetical protein